MSTSPVSDPLFTIQCGKCRGKFPFDDWCRTPVNGELPNNKKQCPGCQHAFTVERKGEAKVFDNGFIIPPDNIIVEQPSTL